MASTTKTSQRGSSQTPPKRRATPSTRGSSKKASTPTSPGAVSTTAKPAATTTSPSPSLTQAPQTPPSSPLALAQQELAARALAKRDLIFFTQRLNPRYHAGWVHQDIARRLKRFSEHVAAGLSPRLMILMPPRHGKSELASRMFPAWHLGHHPDHEIISCAYNVSLAESFSRKVKEAIEDPSYQSVFTTRLHPDFRSNGEWAVANARGGYVAAGVGGGITGKGAHILLIDDPIKNAEEADSAETREKLWDWYGSTAYTRLAPGGGVLVIQTHWHDDDLAGRLKTAMREDPEADQFEVVVYPAIAEHDEYLDEDTDLIEYDTCPARGRLLRSKGAALHPERYDVMKLMRIKKTIPPRFWSALYQQNPVPDDGAYFLKEHFRRSSLPDRRRCNVFVAWDFAISEKAQNDYTVGVVGLQDDNDVLHVVDVVRFKSGDGMYIVESILNLCQKWHNSSLVLGFEDGQIFRAIQSLLKKRMRERNYYPSTQLLKPITDKLARARPLQGRMQQGMVSFVDGAGWFDAARTEMLRFPAGAHDDQVDALAWMTTMAVGREPPQKQQTKAPASWKDKLSIGGTISHMAA